MTEYKIPKPTDETSEDFLTLLLRMYFPEYVWDDSPGDTAKRILKYWKEFSPNYRQGLENLTTFDIPPRTGPIPRLSGFQAQIVLVKDIEFASLCAHHLLPFFGKAHVGYIPADKIIGLSKIPRIVDHYAHQPCTQERLTVEIADRLSHEINPQGVAVVIQSKHTCMACRGIKTHNGSMITSEMLGCFIEEHAPRAEFFNMLGLEK